MNIIALALSAVAILISVLELMHNGRLNRVNLQADYFKRVFDKYFINEIPQNIKYIEFNDKGQLGQDYKQLTITLMNMLEESVYFKYANDKFYYRLCKKISRFDDKMIAIANKRYLAKKNQKKIIKKINGYIKGIVKLVNKYFLSI